MRRIDEPIDACSVKGARQCAPAAVRMSPESSGALLGRNLRQHETFLARGGCETLIEGHDLER